MSASKPRPFVDREPLVDSDFAAASWDHDGGWDLVSPRDPALTIEPSACGIDRRTTLSASEFEQQYVNQQRPVMISSEAFEGVWPALDRWKRNIFAAVYGDIPMDVGKLPYERKVRVNMPAKSMRLSEFIHKITNRQISDERSPEYIFDRSDQALRILHDVGKLRFFNDSRNELVSFQFYLGPARSGANDHFHGHAFNALIYGSKRWFLSPTPFASYSTLSAWDWYNQQYPKLKETHHITECMQRPGDVIYVPSTFGHAVLNTATSIGFSSEFKVHRNQLVDLEKKRTFKCAQWRSIQIS